MALSLGTSGVVFATTDRPTTDPRGQVHAFCHAVPGKWHLMTVMLSAAGSLRWFRDALAPGIDFGELAASAADVPAGSDGLLFLPYLTGERSPHPDPLARGAFVGLTVTHDRRHLTRAVLEGVAFGLRDGLDQMIAAGMPAPTQVRASGGGTASPVWRQILADVLRAEIATVDTTEGAAYGAGLLATVAAGWFPTVEAATDAVIRATPVASPGADVERYAECHERYRELYPALAPTFHRTLGRRRSVAQGGQVLLRDLVGQLAHDDHREDLVLGHLVLVHGADELALEHDADPVGQVEHVVDVVADQEDPDALGLELGDEVADLGGLGRPERRGRLVHDQDPGVEVDGPRDRDRLALAARQRLDRHLEVPEASG